MRTAAESPTDAVELNEVDLTLRHVTHLFPDDLARALLPRAATLTDCAWLDTQVTARERRMDKHLFVVADGVPRIEHVEWQLRWTRSMLLRTFEYHALSTLALHGAAKARQKVARVRSTVVLLGGRRVAPWPAYRGFRTTPAGERFSGLRVRVDAVYQRTLAELASRASPLWMIFAPLAVDARPENIPEVVKALKKRVARRQFEELAVAMTVLADADGRERGLRETITAHLPEELVMRSWVYNLGHERGIEEGRVRGLEEGIEKGIDALRQSIEVALSTRGLKLTAARRAQLAAETRIDVLQRWLTRAITAERAAQVFATR
jgi:hypothetical protein